MDSGADVLPLAQPAVLPGEDLELDEGGGRKKRVGLVIIQFHAGPKNNALDRRRGPMVSSSMSASHVEGRIPLSGERSVVCFPVNHGITV